MQPRLASLEENQGKEVRTKLKVTRLSSLLLKICTQKNSQYEECLQ